MDQSKIYPFLPFETKKIRALRQQIQKPLNKEDLFAVFFLRPFSIYVSLLVVRFTSISANAITALMLYSSFVLPPLVILFLSGKALILAGCAIYIWLYFLDVVDGEVARLRKKTSLWGYFMDTGLWFSWFLTSTVTLIGAYQLGFLDFRMIMIVLATDVAYLFVSVMMWIRDGAGQKLFQFKSTRNEHASVSLIATGGLLKKVAYLFPQKVIVAVFSVIYMYTPFAKELFLAHVSISVLAYSVAAVKKYINLQRMISEV